MKKPSKKYLKNKLDKTWGTLGKDKARCEVCNSGGASFVYNQLHPHHFIGRKNMVLRWDLRNRVWLCPAHHTLTSQSAHNDPEWFRGWMRVYRHKDFLYCNKIKNDIKKWTIEEMQELLVKLTNENKND